MNWNISAWCIRNPITPIILFVLLTVAGINSLMNLGIEEQPNIDIPATNISVSMIGAAPVEIETQITRKIEDAVSGIPNIKHIYSSVTTGNSNTSVQFELGTNSDRATEDVREAVSRIRQELPKGINEPSIQKVDQMGDSSVTYIISATKHTTPELCYLIDNDITRALMATSYVGVVWRYGGVDQEINVDLDPVLLEAHRVSADAVNAQIRAQNIDLPGGRTQINSSEQSIRTLGAVSSLEQLRSMRIDTPDGKWVPLIALGRVDDGYSEMRHRTLYNGQSVVSFEVVRRRGKNIVEMEKGTEQVLETLKKRLPPDIKFERMFTDAKYVKESSSATFEALILGAVLAVIVIYLFLRSGRAALISAFAMPLSIIPTFAYMHVADFTLNDMSLLGLALVIGILVDDAIVEIENIVRHMNMDKTPYTAAIEAADEIGLAVVATTLAAVVVFMPVAFMGGIPGQFFRQFGLTVAVSVFCSLLVARMITPLMAAYWLKPMKEHETGGVILDTYESLLSVCLKHRLITVLAALAFFIASIALFHSLPTSLVSRIDKGESSVNIELAPGSQLNETEEVVKEVVARVEKHPEVQRVLGTIGRGNELNSGRVQITLKPRGERKLSQDEFEEKVRPELDSIPGARITFGGGWGSGRVSVLLTSYDSQALQDTASAVTKEMRGIPQLTDVQSGGASALRPEILVRPDFERASEQGVSVESIARTALIATVGDSDANRPRFSRGDRQIPIVVRINPEFSNRMSVLSNLKVAGTGGKLIPLKSVATISLDSGLFKIDRYDRARQVTITAKFGADYTLGEAMKAVHSLPAFVHRPATVLDHPAGDAEIKQDIFGGFGYAMFTGVMLIYAVLVVLFRGFLQPLTIMMSLPLSLGGALIGLLLFNKPVDMYALIGIVMLMGLVTKNAILLVEYCLAAMEKGVSRTDAIFLAGQTRMRPILMTTTAMIAGMLPIAIGLGAGAEARAPMAIAVVGGLLMSTLLTLLVVPVVFTYFDDLQNFLGKHIKLPNEATQNRESVKQQ